MRTRAWFTSLVVASLAVACGDQPTEVVPERQTTQGQMAQGSGMIALATSSSDDGLSITTDKDDYQPGDTVHFTGAGWPANDVLDILLEDEPATHEPHAWSVPVGEDGTFRDSTYVVDVGDLGVTFTLTATSRATERWLTVVFTDNINNIVMHDAAPTPFSPNQASSAGIEDLSTITLRNPAGNANNVFVRIRLGAALGGTLVKQFAVVDVAGNTDALFVWDGKDNTSSAFVAEGLYTARMTNTAGPNTTEHDTPDRKRTIVVDNTNPTVGVNAISGGTEDEEMTITGTASDLPALAGAGLEKVDVTILRADNSVLTSGSATNTGTNFDTWSFSYTPTETGAQKARAKATDNASNNATSADVAFTVVANNTPPTADAGGPYQGNEGASIALDGSGSSDPDGDDLTYLWAVDVDETAAPYVAIDPNGVCTFVDPSDATNLNAHTLESPSLKCTDDGVFKLTLVVTDENNASSDPSETKVTVKNVKPTVTISPTSRTIAEGGTAGYTATVTDPGTNDDPDDFDFAWTTTVGPCSLSGTPTITSATFSCNDNAPTGTVKLAVDDGDADGDAFDEAGLTVNNVSPTASGLTTNSPVAEGSDITLELADVFDPSTVDAASLRYAFDCGDGNGYGLATTYATAGATNDASCPTTDNGTRTVKGKVFDKDGGANEYSASVTITNVPPTIESLTMLDGDPLPASIIIGATLDIKVTFTDPGSGDTHTGRIDCGTGYSDVNGGNNVASPFQTPCTFATVGSKTIKVKVTDDDGGYDVESHVISVLYNFEGLFAPVDRPNTMNVSKAGQAIPLKWRLTDHEGAPILDFSPAALGVAVSGLQCSVSTALDQIEEYAGNSGLQNLGDGYYQFNWKTPSAYSNTCKAIGLNLGEATPRGPLAYFNFKK